jgi:hypothetical protein
MSIDTALIVISLVVTFFACVSDTTKKTGKFPRNVTLVGWVVIVLAVLTAALSYWDNREKETARNIQENIALRQAETAIYLMMSPYVAISDPPEISDRFTIVEGYGEASVFKGLCNVDITVEVGSTFGNQTTTASWGEFIAEKTRDGINQLNAVQAAYGSLLSDDMNLLIGKVVSHPWNEFLGASQQRAETGANKPRTLCSDRPQIRLGYEALSDEYWPILRDLERSIGRRHCELREKLNIKDVPPLFLRSISGLIYIPDPAVTEPAMDKICKKMD